MAGAVDRTQIVTTKYRRKQIPSTTASACWSPTGDESTNTKPKPLPVPRKLKHKQLMKESSERSCSCCEKGRAITSSTGLSTTGGHMIMSDRQRKNLSMSTSMSMIISMIRCDCERALHSLRRSRNRKTIRTVAISQDLRSQGHRLVLLGRLLG